MKRTIFALRNFALGLSAMLVFVVLFTSCASTKGVVYFNEIGDTKIKSPYGLQEPVIQVNDIISIVISSLNPEASAVFNAPNESSFVTSSASSTNNRLTIGYLVNTEGNIQFPILGSIHVAGMTKSELSKYLADQLTEKKLLVDPIATVRNLNYKVSILGEVNRPGVYSIPNEKLTLLEALSFAGDLTIYAKRTNLLLIRENDKGEKIIRRLDITNPDILTSPYYYLQSNDVIYVEPIRNRLARERSTQTIPVILSALSLIIVGITTFR